MHHIFIFIYIIKFRVKEFENKMTGLFKHAQRSAKSRSQNTSDLRQLGYRKWDITCFLYYLKSYMLQKLITSIISVKVWATDQVVSIRTDSVWFVIYWITLSRKYDTRIAFIWHINVWRMSFLMNETKCWQQHKTYLASKTKRNRRAKIKMIWRHERKL